MSETTARRDFLRVSALAGIALPHVHAAENHTIQLALIGCGGRGTGAVENAFHIQNRPVKLVAMADVFPQKLSDSHGRLRGRFAPQMDVPQERQFIGFEGQIVTFDQMMNHDHEFAPDVDKLTLEGPSPLRASPHGRYAVPEPGIKKTREY